MAKEEGKEKGKEVTKEDMDSLRSELDTKVAAANQRATDAEGRASQAEARVVGKDYDVDLPDADQELTSEKRSELTGALRKGKEAQSNLTQIVPMLVEQQAKALALEVVLEYEAKTDIETIKSRIKAGGTPAKMESIAREISLEYKEKAIEAKAKGEGDDDDNADESGSTRKFAEGGGKGGAGPNKILKDIDDIDVDSPDAQKDLDALYEQLAVKV